MAFKFLSGLYFEWEKTPGKKSDEHIIVTQFFKHNFMYLISWYWFTDMGQIFHTSFDMVVYYVIYLVSSFAYSGTMMAQKYIADVLDAKISFTTTLNL